jgi:hypothetical protein
MINYILDLFWLKVCLIINFSRELQNLGGNKICANPNKRNFDEKSILLILNKIRTASFIHILGNLDVFPLYYKNV